MGYAIRGLSEPGCPVVDSLHGVHFGEPVREERDLQLLHFEFEVDHIPPGESHLSEELE